MLITDQDLHAALPDFESTQKLPGLESTVLIHRDPWGIPHIRAENKADLFFAQGFATAQDRLWHMDFDRHQALGRWAEFSGPSGLARDRLLRAAGMDRTAQLDYQISSPAARAMLDAYTCGVNAFLDTTRALPIEYQLLDQQPEPWESWHCLAVYKMRNSLLGTYEPKLWRTRLAEKIGPENLSRLIRGYPEGQLLTVPPGEDYSGELLDGLADLTRAAEETNWLNETDPGSNAWSISGEYTDSGLPLVAGDSHRALDTPSVYYQAHLAGPDFEIIGYSVPGMPGILHFCHNQYLAWGMTYGNADTQDLFIENFRSTADGLEYAFKGEWHPAQILHETIHVRDADPVDLEVIITHHGPIIAGDPRQGQAVAISDPGLIQGTPWPDAALDAMRSRSIDDLHQAFANWTDRVNNYAVADIHGHFGYLHEGQIPIRESSNGWRAVPGWTGTHEWQGYIPHADLPRAIDPETGYAITCNQRVAAADYPYYVGLSFSPDYRARRIQTRILELPKGNTTPEHMGAIHAERVSLPARILTTALLEIDPPDADCTRALDLLRQWDHSIDRDQVQPTIYARTRQELGYHIARHLFGADATALLAQAGGDNHWRLIHIEVDIALQSGETSLLAPGETWSDTLAQALCTALTALKVVLGPEMAQWQWGRLHRTRPQHPLSAVFPAAASLLNPPSLPVHGDGDTPLAGSHAFDTFDVTGLSVNRYIHDPSDWTRSRWISPLGASGHPASPHYADQARLWADVEFIPQLWNWDQIEKEAETTQLLVPQT